MDAKINIFKDQNSLQPPLQGLSDVVEIKRVGEVTLKKIVSKQIQNESTKPQGVVKLTRRTSEPLANLSIQPSQLTKTSERISFINKPYLELPLDQNISQSTELTYLSPVAENLQNDISFMNVPQLREEKISKPFSLSGRSLFTFIFLSNLALLGAQALFMNNFMNKVDDVVKTKEKKVKTSSELISSENIKLLMEDQKIFLASSEGLAHKIDVVNLFDGKKIIIDIHDWKGDYNNLIVESKQKNIINSIKHLENGNTRIELDFFDDVEKPNKSKRSSVQRGYIVPPKVELPQTSLSFTPSSQPLHKVKIEKAPLPSEMLDDIYAPKIEAQSFDNEKWKAHRGYSVKKDSGFQKATVFSPIKAPEQTKQNNEVSLIPQNGQTQRYSQYETKVLKPVSEANMEEVEEHYEAREDGKKEKGVYYFNDLMESNTNLYKDRQVEGE
jgi:hypothetical protein